jgi:hypothetical protein
MNRDIQLDKSEQPAERPLPLIIKRKLDLVILRYMARSVYVALLSLDWSITKALPLLYYLDERRRRIHRIAIYNPEELLLNHELALVGFISGKMRPLRPSIAADLRITDRKLVAELANSPGLLSYSSLELHDGNWCNLVLINDPKVKIHLKNTETHRYASHELAPNCYEWIRLHNGIMPSGLASNEMLLQKTTYYQFQEAHQRPVIRELRYSK